VNDGPELWREILEQLDRIDGAVYEAVVSTPTDALDETLASLSDLANHSKLWLAVAATLAVSGGRRGRRAALEGVAAIALASSIANLAAKNLADRPRPARERDDRPFPEGRRVRMPTSTSFPSGHTASAYAFSSAVGARMPLLWIPLRLLALTIAYSRVHTGVHYPGDVVAGALLGSACGKTITAAGRRFDERTGR
jgi:membrane-associated phospholipid phosphatase